ncbi:hypothetical protein CMO84_08565, partial [Candidatus Woesearchaeota archaeon]|nr:hypothetical protein [Candidatus Woesearchaeota archaeon]
MSDTSQPSSAPATEDPLPGPEAPQKKPTPRPTDSAWDVYWPKGDDPRANSVRLASFPLILYFWPTLLTFMGCAGL